MLVTLVSANGFAEQVYRYRMFEQDSGKTLGEQVVKVIKKGDQLEIHRSYQDPLQPDRHYKTLSVLASDLSTLRYLVKDTMEESDYLLEIKEETLRVKGVFRGTAVDDALEIGDKPFFHDPSVSLSRFALSNEPEQIFQVINPNDQTLYDMVATRQGEKKLQMGDRFVEAVGVKWTLTGFRSMFFEQVFWFRKTDGVFLTQDKATDNLRSELLIE